MEPSFIILDLERHHAGWRRWVWIRRRQLRPDVARSLHGRGRWRALSAVSYLTVPTTIVVGPKPELVDDLEQLHGQGANRLSVVSDGDSNVLVGCLSYRMVQIEVEGDRQ
jgi:hypothetical protein